MLNGWTLVTRRELFQVFQQVRDIIGCVIVKEDSSSRVESLIQRGPRARHTDSWPPPAASLTHFP